MIEHFGHQVVEELPERQRQEGALILRRSQRLLLELKHSEVILVNFVSLSLNERLKCPSFHETIKDKYLLTLSNFLGATRFRWLSKIVFFFLSVTLLTENV